MSKVRVARLRGKVRMFFDLPVTDRLKLTEYQIDDDSFLGRVMFKIDDRSLPDNLGLVYDDSKCWVITLMTDFQDQVNVQGLDDAMRAYQKSRPNPWPFDSPLASAIQEGYDILCQKPFRCSIFGIWLRVKEFFRCG